MDINRFETKEEAAATAGEAVNHLLMMNKTAPVLLLLSSGSSLSVLDYISASALGGNLTITMLDERFSQNAEINNFLQLQKLDFYPLAQEANANFIGTLPRNGENIDDMRARWEIALKKWRKDNPQGKIFATFGMGADGHIAGIFPYSDDAAFFENTFENQHWVAGYKAASKHEYPDRLTTTFPFFKNIDEAILFVCGEEKRPALEKLMKGDSQPHELPALAIYETKHSQIFTDIR